MHALALALAVLAAAPHIPPSLDLAGGAVSPVVSLIAWDKGCSDSWGAGIPAPTIDCAAVGTSASAALQCSGATPTFAGPAQVAAGSPWWYRGDAAVRPSILLNGSTDWWDLGDVADPADDLAACVGWRNNATGVQSLWGKYAASGKGWIIYTNTTSVVVEVCKAGPTCTSITLTGANVAGAFSKACFGYDYVADGTSVLRLVVNGVAATAVTNAVGPIGNVATTLRLGSDGYDERVNGAIRRGAIWTGADAPTSAAQLAQMVATQNGLAADKPSGTVATHARTDSTLCCPFSDAECYWVGPGAPCIHAPSYQGWASGGAVAGGVEVYGIGQNGTGYSEDLSSWTGYNYGSTSTVVTVNATTAPDGTLTADEVAFGVADDSPVKYSVLSKTEAYYGDASAYCQTIWAKGKTESGTLRFGLTTTGTNGIGTCAVGTTWTRCQVCQSLTAATRYFQIGPHSVDAPAWTVYLWGAQTTKTAYPVPYRSTPGASPYSGTASTATTLTVPVALTGPARWAIGLTYTGPGAWGVADRFWTLGTAANSAYLAAGYLGIFDAANAQLYSFVSPVLASGTHSTLVEYRSPSASLRIDGADRALSFTGAGSGVLGALSPTITIGNGPSPGLVSRVAQCRRAGGCR